MSRGRNPLDDRKRKRKRRKRKEKIEEERRKKANENTVHGHRWNHVYDDALNPSYVTDMREEILE